jgi:NADH:ubiquinone oxidoreductase subunit E
MAPQPSSLAVDESAAIDLAALEEVFARYEGQSGALIPVLQRAQEIYGYVPPEVLQHIADRLGVSLGKVYGVATFYAQFYLERRGSARSTASPPSTPNSTWSAAAGTCCGSATARPAM